MKRFVGACMLVLVLPHVVFSQSLNRVVFDRGGGRTTAGNIQLLYSIGQPAVGEASNADLTAEYGYWRWLTTGNQILRVEASVTPQTQVHHSIALIVNASASDGSALTAFPHNYIAHDLQQIGYAIVPADTCPECPVLKIYYKEVVGSQYGPWPSGFISPGSLGIQIGCHVVLNDVAGKLLYQTNIRSETPRLVVGNDLVNPARDAFLSESSIVYLGLRVAMALNDTSLVLDRINDRRFCREATSLLRGRGTTTLPYLTRAAASKDEWVRACAATAIAEIDDPYQQLPLLSHLLLDQSSDVRAAAAKALGKVRDPAAADSLMTALPYSAGSVTVTLAEILADIKDRRAIQRLVDAMRCASSDDREKEIALQITRFGSEGITALESALSNRDPCVRCGAALALAEVGDTLAVRELLLLLSRRELASYRRGGEDISRVCAVKALGVLKRIDAIEPLMSLLKNPRISDDECHDIVVALERITNGGYWSADVHSVNPTWRAEFLPRIVQEVNAWLSRNRGERAR